MAAAEGGLARRLLALLTVLLVGLLSVGCDRAAPAPTPPTLGGDPATQATLDALAAAVLRADHGAFAAATDFVDPAFVPLAERLYGLSRLPLTELRLRLRGPRTALGPERRAALGAQAWSQQVTVRWRLADDRGPAEHALDLAFRSEAGRTRLAGAGAPRDQVAVPLWWQQDVTLRRTDRVTVLAPDAVLAAAWLARGRAAVAAVAGRLPTGLAAGWPRSLVIEVPTTRQGFERVLGVPPGGYAAIAAVTWPEGPDPADAALRVVVNPALAARLDATSVAVLLAHEVVHVASRSASSGAPLWLVEGYADYLAYAAYPAAEPAAARELLAYVRASGAPRTLPTDADFRPDSAALARHYAVAWSVCRFVATDASPAALGRFYRLADARAGLDAAARAALGSDVSTLTARWRRDLAARARGS